MALTDNQSWLYKEMTGKRVNLGSEDDFAAAMQDEKNRQWVYEQAGQLGLNIGTPEQFALAMTSDGQPAQQAGVSGGSLLSEQEELARQNAIQGVTSDPNHPLVEQRPSFWQSIGAHNPYHISATTDIQGRSRQQQQEAAAQDAARAQAEWESMLAPYKEQFEAQWKQDAPVLNEVWNKANERAKAAAESVQRNKPQQVNLPSVMGGGFGNIGYSLIASREANKQNSPEAIVDAFERELDNKYQSKDVKGDAQLAQEMGATIDEYQLYKRFVEDKIAERFVGQNIPQDKLDYFARKFIQGNLIAQLASLYTQSPQSRQYAMQGTQQYEQANPGWATKGVAIGAEVANVVADPLMWIMPGVGEAAGRGIVNAAGRRLASVGLSDAAGAAERAAMQRGLLRTAQRLTSGGVMMAGIDTGHTLIGELYQTGEVNWSNLATAPIRGALTGMAFAGGGALGERVQKAVGDAFGRDLGLVAGRATHFASGTNIMVGSGVASHILQGGSLNDVDWGNEYANAAAMQLFFDIQGGLKTASKAGGLRKAWEAMRQDPMAHTLTREEIEQFNAAGIEGKDAYTILKSLNGGKEFGSLEEYYRVLNDISADERIDTQAKYKLASLLYGKVDAHVSPIYVGDIESGADGYVVKTYDNGGMVYETRKFDTQKAAEAYRVRQYGATRNNMLEWVEGIIRTRGFAEKMQEVTDGAIAKTIENYPQLSREDAYRVLSADEGSLTPIERAIRSQMEKYLAEDIKGSDILKGVREQVAREQGVSIDDLSKLLSREYSRLSAKDKTIFESYLNRLNEYMPRNNERTDRRAIEEGGGSGPQQAEEMTPEQRMTAEVTQYYGERTHDDGNVYPVQMAGDAERQGFVVGTVSPAINEKGRITNNDVVTVKWSDGTVTQENAKDLNLTATPGTPDTFIRTEVANRMDQAAAEQAAVERVQEQLPEGTAIFVNDTEEITATDNGDGTYSYQDAQGMTNIVTPEQMAEQGYALIEGKQQPAAPTETQQQDGHQQAPQQSQAAQPAAPVEPVLDKMTAADYAGAAVEFMGSRERVDKFLEAEIANTQSQLKAAERKKVTRYNGIADFNAQQELIDREKKALQDRLDKLTEAREKAKSYLTIAEREQRAQAEAERRAAEEAARIAREQAAAAEAARLEQERIDRELKKGVPDFSEDNDRDARNRGFHVVNGRVIHRQEPLQPLATGKAVTVQFAKGQNGAAEAHHVLIPVSMAQPSHINGQRNPAFFISEAQPKDRRDQVSKVTSDMMAQNIHPDEIVEGATAYVGAPVLNGRGEAVQGNNRLDALIKMYQSHPESVAKYKQYLIDNAEALGYTETDIETIRNNDVIDVRMLDNVTDEQAIQLWQKKATDLETGGVQLIDPQVTANQLGDRIQRFSEILLRSEDDEATLADLTLRNGRPALEFLQKLGIISDAQMQSAFDSRGNLTAEAKAALQGVLKQVLFQNAESDNLPIMFDDIPVTAQKAILQTIVRDLQSPEESRLVPDIQEAIGALYRALHQSAEVKNGRNEQEIRAAMRSWALQMQFPSDFDAENFVPSEKFSNFALELATLFKYGKQTEIAKALNAYYDAVQGTTGSLFGDTPAIPHKEAIKQIFGIDYKSVDEARREKHRKELTDYLNTIADEAHPFELYGNDNFIDLLIQLGTSPRKIEYVRNQLANGKTFDGFTIKNKLYLNTDGLDTTEKARSKYIHERQHLLTTKEQIERVMRAASREELDVLVEVLSQSGGAYSNESHDVLADEFISYSMEEAYAVESDEELESILRAAGANDELINIIKSINNEQRENDERLGQSERLGNARRPADVRTDSQGHSPQNGRDQGKEPGVLEQTGAGTTGRGGLGGRTGGENRGSTEGAGLSEVGSEGVSGEEAGGAGDNAGIAGENQGSSGVGQERGLGEVRPTQREQLTDYLNGIADEEHKPILFDNSTLVETLRNIGATPDAIAEAQSLVVNGGHIEGFYLNGYVCLDIDNLPDAERARTKYVHERQHDLTRKDIKRVKEVEDVAPESELKSLLEKFSNSPFYNKQKHSIVADEFISFAMEEAYKAKDDAELESALRAFGVKDELIDIIKSINNEQRGIEAFAMARRNAPDNHSAESSSRESSADSGTQSEGGLGREGFDTDQQSLRRTEGRGDGVPAAGEVSSTKFEAADTEIGGALVDRLEDMGVSVSTDLDANRAALKAAKADKSDAGAIHYYKSPDDLRLSVSGTQTIPVGKNTLVGLHNISAEKLRKALKMGGLANPSAAVIDLARQNHHGYGEVSLVMPSSLVDSESGRNAGTYAGDAYTPMYPNVEYRAGKETAKRLDELTKGLPEDLAFAIQNNVRDYMDKNRNYSGLEYVYLAQQGRELPIELTPRRYPNISIEDIYKRLGMEYPGFYDSSSYDAYEKLEGEQLAEFNLWLEQYGDQEKIDKRKEMVARMRSEGKDGAANYMEDRWGEHWSFAAYDSALYRIMQDGRDAGKENYGRTIEKAQTIIDTEGMRPAFEAWLQKEIDKLGYNEVIFAGWTRDGDRRYLPNTIENASRLMNKEGDTNWREGAGVSETKSMLMPKFRTLNQIRKHKDILEPEEEKIKTAYEEVGHDWTSLGIDFRDYTQKDGHAYGLDDNPFIAVDNALMRIQEAMMKADPIAYLNREYRYQIQADNEWAGRIAEMKDRIANLPSRYFETKFRRPVYLDEFRNAVVPNDLPTELRDGLEKAGLTLFEYDPKEEGARRAATLQATDDEGIRFSVSGGLDTDRTLTKAAREEMQQIKDAALADGTFMKAPNGKRSNLNERQWLQVRLRSFKRWFGDWENDPENASKVLDENGEPMVAKHGTPYSFTIFDENRQQQHDAGWLGRGFYFFTKNDDYAAGYAQGGRVLNTFLNIREPYFATNEDMERLSELEDREESARFTQQLIDDGYDGVYFDGDLNGEYVAFSPNQIKSATDNDGSFSEENDDIRFSISNQNNDIFYSNAERAVEGIKQEKATPEQWRAMIEKAGGLKAGEDKWIGLSDWLAQQRPTVELQPNETRSQFVVRLGEASKKFTISKQDILDYIREHKIQIEEQEYGEYEEDALFLERKDEFKRYYDEAVEAGEEDPNEVAWDRMIEEYGDDFSMGYYAVGDELMRDNDSDYAQWEADSEGRPRNINETRLRYTTWGLENKREIALIVPDIEEWNENDEIHFGDAGPGKAIAWVRFGDAHKIKYGENGEELADVLVIDEIQSKRHQEGRERGYVDSETAIKYRQLEKETSKAQLEYHDYRDQLWKKYENQVRTRGEMLDVLTPEEKSKHTELQEKYENLYDRWEEFKKNIPVSAIPAAPFEKNWHELAMKRILRFAAENGYDKVAWTTGEQQAKRYDIGKEIDHIVKTDENTYEVYPTSGLMMTLEFDENGMYADEYDREYNGKSMSDIFGKDLAKRLKEMPVDETFQGDGLRVGYDGMKGFYDDILPRFMQKYGKKWGVQVGEVTMPQLEDGYQTMHAIDITPEMRESVLEGQPMFSISGRKPTVNAIDGVQTINLNKENIDLSTIYNRRFMYNPKTGTLVLGKERASIEYESHAEELAKSGVEEPFDDFARGWIGYSKRGAYKNGIIHFAPSIGQKNFEQGFETLSDLAGEIGINGNTIIRGFVGKWEQPLSEIFPNRFPNNTIAPKPNETRSQYIARVAEKEAKYANMSSGRAVTLNEQDDEEETTPEAQITNLDYPQFANQTEAQQLATAALVEVLNDNTDLDVFLATDEQMPEDGSEKETRRDRDGFQIGDGTWHMPYEVRQFPDYPQIEARVSKASTTESVYVTYTNKNNGASVKVRFSNHMSNNARWGVDLPGFAAENGQILERLGLAEGEWQGNSYVPVRSISKAELAAGNYEVADKTRAELSQLPIGTDISEYKGKLVPDMTNNAIYTSDKVVEDQYHGRRIYRDANGNIIPSGRTREAMLTPDGTLYGWAIGDRIYLTKDGLNPNSPIHEYSHIWAKAMMRNNREGWQSIVDIFKGMPFWDEVVNDPNYQGLTTDDAICSEALARYSGQRGAARMEEWAKEEQYEAEQSGSVLRGAKVRQLINRAKKALADFWHWVGVNLFGIKHFDSAKQVADRILWDMLNGTELGDHIRFSVTGGENDKNGIANEDDQTTTDKFKAWFGDWQNDPEHASKVVDADGKPLVVEHSTPNEFTTFDINRLGENSGDRGIFGAGFYFGDRGNTDIYGKSHMQVYLNMRKPFVMEDYMPDDISAFIVEHFNTPALRKIVLNENGKNITVGEYNDIVNAVNAEMEEGKHDAEIERISSFYRPDSARRKVRDDAIADKSFLIPGSLNYLISTMIGSQEFTNALRENGNDGVIVGKGNGYNEYVVFSPNQIKSATNNSGEFSKDNNDIRFSVNNPSTLSRSETVTKALVQQANNNYNIMQSALKKVTADLKGIRAAMRMQSDYDRKVVDALLNLYNTLLQENGVWAQYMPDTTRRIATQIVHAIGKKDISTEVNTIMDHMVDAQAKAAQRQWDKLRQTPIDKINISGVVMQGKVALEGQHALKALNEVLDPENGITLLTLRGDHTDPNKEVDGLIDQLMQMEDNATDESQKLQYKGQWIGYEIAAQYLERIQHIQEERKQLDLELKKAQGNMALKPAARKQLVESIKQAMRDNDLDQADAYMQSTRDLQEYVSTQEVRAKDFIRRQGANRDKIRSYAQRDLEGLATNPNRNRTRGAIARQMWDAIASPIRDLQSLLRLTGLHAPDGEGYLYNHFMRGWMDAADQEYTGIVAASKTLDEKISELTHGKYKTWEEAARKINDASHNMFTVTMLNGVDGKDMPVMEDIPLSAGNALYIYAVNKMNDGRMKLAGMNITEDDVKALTDKVREQFGQEILDVVDWVQREFFSQLRNRYNPTHEALFGAPMDAIENYFPLRINAAARQQNEDLSEPDTDAARLLAGTSTGAIKRRTKNSLPLDVRNADFFQEVIRHIAQMERWNAFAQWNRDANILFSDINFRNRIKGMNGTIYGSGDQLYNYMKDAFRVAIGTYKPKTDQPSEITLNIAKGVTSAKINFRIWTALKQIASFPAFFTYMTDGVFVGSYLRNWMTPHGTMKWARENLPNFEKRVSKRDMGDMRLMQRTTDWQWNKRVLEWSQKYGMAANVYFDTLTCATGARAVYDSRLAEYLKKGYPQEQAEQRARQDSEQAFNTSQQSSEGAFMSPVQMDRNVYTAALTVFRTSPIQYTRNFIFHTRNLLRKFGKGSKEEQIAFRMGQYKNDGLKDEQARKAAEKDYNKSIRSDIAGFVVYGALLNLLWRLVGQVPYLLLGDDDDKKKQLIDDTTSGGAWFSPFTGLMGGGVIESALDGNGSVADMFAPELPFTQDVKRVGKYLDNDKYAEFANQALSVAMQSGTGFDPQTAGDVIQRIVTTIDSEEELSAAEQALRISQALLSIPQSQYEQQLIDRVVADERKYDAALADYIRYQKVHTAPLTWWMRGEESTEKAEEKAVERFNRLLNERDALHNPEEE